MSGDQAGNHRQREHRQRQHQRPWQPHPPALAHHIDGDGKHRQAHTDMWRAPRGMVFREFSPSLHT